MEKLNEVNAPVPFAGYSMGPLTPIYDHTGAAVAQAVTTHRKDEDGTAVWLRTFQAPSWAPWHVVDPIPALASAPAAKPRLCAPTWEEVKEANSVLASYSWNSNGEGGGVTATERKLATALLRVAGVEWNPNGDPEYKLRAPVSDKRASEHIETLRRMRADYKPSNGPISTLKAAALDAALFALASAPVAGEAQPVYQIRLPGDSESVWRDATGDAYWTVTEANRRIVYAAPQASEAVQEFIAATDALLASEARKTWTSGFKNEMTIGDRIRAAERFRVARAALVANTEKTA